MTDIDVKPRIPVTQPQHEEEQLSIQIPVGGTIWAVRIPRFLYDKWAQVEQGGVHLGTLLVDHAHDPPKLKLKLPGPPSESGSGSGPDAKPDVLIDLKADPANGEGVRDLKPNVPPPSAFDTSGLPPEFDLNVPAERAKNTWVFSETIRQVNGLRMDGSMLGKRKREKAHPALLGAVQHECTLNPIVDRNYVNIVKHRRVEAEHGRRPIMSLESVETNKGRLNQMSGGWANVISKMGKGLVTDTSRTSPMDKATRLPRSTLLNMLFTLFRQKPYWGIGALRQETAQPDGYLRDVLRDVAVQVAEGPYRNLFELRAEWKAGGAGAGATGDGSKPDIGSVKDQDPDLDDNEVEGDEEDWDEEDDFEEVMS